MHNQEMIPRSMTLTSIIMLKYIKRSFPSSFTKFSYKKRAVKDAGLALSGEGCCFKSCFCCQLSPIVCETLQNSITEFCNVSHTIGLGSSCGVVVKLLACGARGPGFDSWSRPYDFKDWLSPATKSRYGWKIAKAT